MLNKFAPRLQQGEVPFPEIEEWKGIDKIQKMNIFYIFILQTILTTQKQKQVILLLI